jgi:L-alanine-DL-glutamate epimerase-like enolase superfamily enzyme
MRIVRLESWRLDLPLKTPYSIAYQRVERAPNVFVRLVTEGARVGSGCAAPDEDVTGESPEATEAALAGPAAEMLRGQDADRPVHLMELLRAPLAAAPAARAAVDMALWDLMARRAGLPLWKLLGGYRERIATSITLGILPLEETVEEARRRCGEGFRVLKLKGGLDATEDAQRVRAVRAAVGPGVALRFDANQGYSPPAQLGELGRRTVPVMADESVLSLADAYRLARAGTIDMVNVKLMKVGGIAEALRLSALARAAGLAVMMGCMDEAALAIAAGLAVALARPGVTHADLDGHLDLGEDPTAGAVRLDAGWLYPADGPGLGVSL